MSLQVAIIALLVLAASHLVASAAGAGQPPSAPAPPPPTGEACGFQPDTFFEPVGASGSLNNVTTPEACCESCSTYYATDPGACAAWSWVSNTAATQAAPWAEWRHKCFQYGAVGDWQSVPAPAGAATSGFAKQPLQPPRPPPAKPLISLIGTGRYMVRARIRFTGLPSAALDVNTPAGLELLRAALSQGLAVGSELVSVSLPVLPDLGPLRRLQQSAGGVLVLTDFYTTGDTGNPNTRGTDGNSNACSILTGSYFNRIQATRDVASCTKALALEDKLRSSTGLNRVLTYLGAYLAVPTIGLSAQVEGEPKRIDRGMEGLRFSTKFNCALAPSSTSGWWLPLAWAASASSSSSCSWLCSSRTPDRRGASWRGSRFAAAHAPASGCSRSSNCSSNCSSSGGKATLRRHAHTRPDSAPPAITQQSRRGSGPTQL